jgi:DNA-binding transcriptional LysR family regulator
MDDLNDLFFFAAVVQHQGFSAAARAIGIEKTRLSRRVAALEQRLGVRLLQRSTRTVALTEAGERFYERCQAVVEGARSAYDGITELKREPSGNVRVSCPVVLAQSYLAPILPGYMAAYPKVLVYLESTDRTVHLLDERFDMALRVGPRIEDAEGLVARELGRARRILVASPTFLSRFGRPEHPAQLTKFETISSIGDVHDGRARWTLSGTDGHSHRGSVLPRLVSSDLRVQLEAAINGIGIALMPEPIVSSALRSNVLEHVLPTWAAPDHVVHLVYPSPRGVLPSVRSLIDYMLIHVPASILERSA